MVSFCLCTLVNINYIIAGRILLYFPIESGRLSPSILGIITIRPLLSNSAKFISTSHFYSFFSQKKEIFFIPFRESFQPNQVLIIVLTFFLNLWMKWNRRATPISFRRENPNIKVSTAPISFRRDEMKLARDTDLL